MVSSLASKCKVADSTSSSNATAPSTTSSHKILKLPSFANISRLPITLVLLRTESAIVKSGTVACGPFVIVPTARIALNSIHILLNHVTPANIGFPPN